MSKASILILSLILALIIIVTSTVVYNKTKKEPDTDDQITTQTSQETSLTSSEPTSTSTVNLANEVTATVTYNGTSFSPRTLTITSGETVTFVNNSKQQMWVASDPHPQHTNLSGFDALRGYGAGQSYSYTFTKAGNYQFHDHLNEDAHGTITVQE